MRGIKEAVKKAGLKLLDRDAVIDSGKRAYRMGIELRNNPRKSDSERNLWEIGWNHERDSFSTLLKRNGGSLR